MRFRDADHRRRRRVEARAAAVTPVGARPATRSSRSCRTISAAPLHAIGLACEALRGQPDQTGTRYIAAIERAAHRAERLIVDLLEANAIENGAIALNPHAIDAAAVVRQAASDHELLVKETKASIDTAVPSEPTLVAADRDRVLQVLGNLIGNALKHARGAPIELRLERLEGEARIAVRDHGPGISELELPHVFDRYWTGRDKRGGSGLGLAIAKGIVDAHGGKLAVTSRRNEGAEFRVHAAARDPLTALPSGRGRPPRRADRPRSCGLAHWERRAELVAAWCGSDHSRDRGARWPGRRRLQRR